MKKWNKFHVHQKKKRSILVEEIGMANEGTPASRSIEVHISEQVLILTRHPREDDDDTSPLTTAAAADFLPPPIDPPPAPPHLQPSGRRRRRRRQPQNPAIGGRLRLHAPKPRRRRRRVRRGRHGRSEARSEKSEGVAEYADWICYFGAAGAIIICFFYSHKLFILFIYFIF